MPPRFRVRPLLLAATLAIAACTSGPVSESFDASAPCPAEGRFAGAYPDLEALVPRAYRGDAPERLDSGRNCTSAQLGSLASQGIKEVRFAGGTWGFGGERALVMAVFQGDGLDADKLASFYASSATGNSRTTIDSQTTPTVAGRPGHRLDTT